VCDERSFRGPSAALGERRRGRGARRRRGLSEGPTGGPQLGGPRFAGCELAEARGPQQGGLPTVDPPCFCSPVHTQGRGCRWGLPTVEPPPSKALFRQLCWKSMLEEPWVTPRRALPTLPPNLQGGPQLWGPLAKEWVAPQGGSQLGSPLAHSRPTRANQSRANQFV
jgi:hypothetical protein